MGKSPSCSKVGLRKGPWSAQEDMLLVNYIQAHGAAKWRSLPKKTGLQRCGKSCRLRWINYLCPGIKRGNITPDEEDLIIRLHSLLGNRWSLIAGRLPGRTDNEIKNYWNTHLIKKLKNAGFEPKSSNKNATKTPKESQNKAAVRADQSNDASMIKNNSEAAAKIKVYVPKPIRLTREFSSYNSINSSSLRSSNHEEANKEAIVDEEAKAEEVSHFAWPFIEIGDANYNGGIHVGEDDQLLIEDCNFSLQDLVPTINDNMLEKVYAEYLQLI